ncbi:MAG: YgjP-like metallopeptidase domain-containing protein, partial [Ketobacteraceae bacterium]|nr:YgjP-like metallopeptidase domain-containing protein [Ketobacteraceae bacterium]
MQQDLFEINFRLVRSRRKSVAIHVLRNGDVEVRAPRRAPESMIRAFVSDKRDWIARKQAEWQQLPSPHRLIYRE